MMIKNCTKFVLIAGIGFSLFSGLSQAALDQEDSLIIISPSVTASSRLGLGAFALIHDTEGFSVFEKNGKKSRVQNRLIDKSLRGIPQSGLEGFLKNNGRLSVNRGSDGEYSLRVSGGLDGGSLNPFDRLAKAVELASKNLQGTVGPAVATVSEAVLANAKATTKLATALEASNQLTAGNLTSSQQALRDYSTCLGKHPLKKGTEGTVVVPSACAGYFNAWNKTLPEINKNN